VLVENRWMFWCCYAVKSSIGYTPRWYLRISAIDSIIDVAVLTESYWWNIQTVTFCQYRRNIALCFITYKFRHHLRWA
jgi:hypothetical protein